MEKESLAASQPEQPQPSTSDSEALLQQILQENDTLKHTIAKLQARHDAALQSAFSGAQLQANQQASHQLLQMHQQLQQRTAEHARTMEQLNKKYQQLQQNVKSLSQQLHEKEQCLQQQQHALVQLRQDKDHMHKQLQTAADIISQTQQAVTPERAGKCSLLASLGVSNLASSCLVPCPQSAAAITGLYALWPCTFSDTDDTCCID